MTNRVVITLDPNGEIHEICADEPVEIYWNCPHVPHDRVYLYESAKFGPQHVRAAIGGYAVGHGEDGILNEGSAPFLPPSKPTIGLVKSSGDDDATSRRRDLDLLDFYRRVRPFGKSNAEILDEFNRGRAND